MKDLWVKIGCFITGYNYKILQNSTESSRISVKKFLSAILIATILWGFVGYAFTQRYLHGSKASCLVGAIVMIIIVIQIERQIILSIGHSNRIFYFRIVIGFIMAIIGSIILDQIIFKDDVENAQIIQIDQRVDSLLPIETTTLNAQIIDLQNKLQSRQHLYDSMTADIGRHKTISIPTVIVNKKRDSLGKLVISGKTISYTQIPNPQANQLPIIESQIKYFQAQIDSSTSKLINIQDVLRTRVKSTMGFLNELNTLFGILKSSSISLIIWLLIFLFLGSIEIFVLMNKWGDNKHNYEKIIQHQEEIEQKRLDYFKDTF